MSPSGKASVLSHVTQTFIYEKAETEHARERVSRRKRKRSDALHTGNNLAAVRLETPVNIAFLRNVVRTEFYGSVRRRLLHRSFLFAPSKYLTPIFQVILTAPSSFSVSSEPNHHAVPSVYPLPYAREALIFQSLFPKSSDRILHGPRCLQAIFRSNVGVYAM